MTVLQVFVMTALAPLLAFASPPNLVFVMVDDLGWSGFGFTDENTEVKSPTIDRLARSGVIFEAHYTYKFCSPTRASFLTGRVPGHGIQEVNLGQTSESACNGNLTMLGAKLRSGAGYATAMVGKWHQGFYSAKYTPQGRGFDSSLGFLGGGEDHLSQCHACDNSIPAPDYATEKFSCPASYSPCGVKCPDQGGVDMYCTDGPCLGRNTTANPYVYAEEVTRVVRAAAATKKPLFLYLALHNVHQPVESPLEFVDMYPAGDYNSTNEARRVYNGMHSAADWVVRNLTGELESADLWNNTVLVLAGDNGGTFEHAGPVPGSSNFPLRGHKYSWFEGGVRVASFLSSPLLPATARGTRSAALMHISDWYPTFSALAGIKDTGDDCAGNQVCPPVDGLNVWPSITGTAPPPRTELLLGVGGKARRGALVNISGAQRFKYIAMGGNTPNADGWSAQYPGTTDAIPAPPDGACTKRACLFDLASDPRETRDMIDVLPDVAAAMAKRYEELAAAKYMPNEYSSAAADKSVPDDCDHDACWEGAGYWSERHGGTAATHSPRINASPACDKMRETGFWAPWK